MQVKRASDDRVLWQGRATAQSGGNGPAGGYSVDTGRVLCGGSVFAAMGGLSFRRAAQPP
ncbi:hypothetical protein AB0L65_50405 [Nonomuraea sp. NPDC052116]|uniref:hypothetical protein n=1 Tax=Nonomuraea sp. NPDC052116 TaxID=3155665 RepID=UPI00341406C2